MSPDPNATLAGTQHFTFDNGQNSSTVGGHVTWYQDAAQNETVVHAGVIGAGTLEIHLAGVLTLNSQSFML